MYNLQNSLPKILLPLVTIFLATTLSAHAEVACGSMHVFYWNPIFQENSDKFEYVSRVDKHQSKIPEEFLQVDDVSQSFKDEILEAAATLPQGVVDALSHAGYKLELSHSVPDAVPSARNQQVRGYAPHSTWNDVFGMFNRTTSKIIMAQFASLPSGKQAAVESELLDKQRRLGILRHECGHAVDDYLGNFSHTAKFKETYAKEKAAIAAGDKKTLSYYLQPGDAGCEETFAELFAASGDMGCDRQSDMLLQKYFPALSKMISTKLASLR